MMKNSNSCNIYDLKFFNINDFDILLHKILKQIREIVNAQAGTIYISDGKYLSFNVFQNDSLSYEDIYKQYLNLKDVKIPINNDEKYLAVDSYINEKIIIVNDIQKSSCDDFLGVKEYDDKYNYKTHSIITVPIIHPLDNEKLGVLQLINKQDKSKNFNFDEKDKDTLSMTSSLIALSISKAKDDTVKLKELNLELKATNDKLEQKVKYEMSESEKKSTIIFHQSKLASMGEMIGNIAHQWRQPLNAISMLASGLDYKIENEMYDKEEASSSLKQIVETTQYLSHTIDDFRNFYKIDKEAKSFNLAENLFKSISITSASLSENNIEVIYDVDKSISYYGYDNELKQAILNILQNAKDAFIINKVNSKRYIFIKLKKVNEDILIEIKDNAGGIQENILNKVFERDFTTKEKLGGTGIGLYMTKYILKKSMNSEINVKNSEYHYNDTLYKGALFTIKLKLNSNKNQ